MVPSLRSFRMGGYKKDPALSPTLSATTTASAFDWGDGQERMVIVTRADLRASVAAYEGLLTAAKAYRNALLALSAASTGFAGALGECARVKGAGESGDGLLAASGLQYMVANSGQVLSDTVYRSFEIPLLHAYDNYAAALSARHAEYEALLADKTAAIRKTEDENLKQGRKKNRDLSQFRQALERLQEQVREVEVCKRSYYHETLENETETWGMIEGKVAHLLRSTLDLSDRLASKATSDPTLERLLAEHPDPFDSYRPETEEPRDMFSVLPPLMQFGLAKPGSSSKKGSLIDHDAGSAGGGATPTKDRERDGDAYSRGSRNSAGARSRGKGEESSATATPRQPARKAVSVGDVLGLNPPPPPPLDHSQSAPDTAAFAHHSSNHQRPANLSLTSTGYITSPTTDTSRPLSPVSPSPPDLAAAPPESPSPIRALNTTVAAADPEDKWRGVTSPTRSPRSRRESGRRGLTRVSEQEPELDPYAGDWGAPQGYQGNLSPAMLGNAGFDSGSDDEGGR